ncbi:SUMF1/EgtB/PvdO family nonheme iron enzyme [Aureivirga sp. CE67]|uniref:SUMF1/EgtB/PvdO family nonheme iron enzyme n=1 Tax=Aureivirga sp. CE67 TaxID=1788983 RepID=UPI0018C919CA|nr:SUMF1/EgtB/PvdO family nonheme iron enzyme [Aureivirga sp. CE67]
MIVDLDAFELIPDLLKISENQKERKDPNIMTVLCLLMKNDYKPFKESQIYKDLYVIDDSVEFNNRTLRDRTIPFTWKNYNQIVKFAEDYYQYKIKSPSKFVRVEGGEYEIGEKNHSQNPARKVKLEPFEISKYEITNREFGIFVEETGYVTLAEKREDAMVFRVGLNEFEWVKDSTAYWRFPNGKSQGGIEDKMSHPVTCISYVDAKMYCQWRGVELPTIEQWEVASRGGSKFQFQYFGEKGEEIFEHGNIWRGKNHLFVDEKEDAITTSPVGSYKPNPIGLYDVYGNVFEFCLDKDEFFFSKEIINTRGGSWWCSIYACGFFNSIDLGTVHREASFSNNGFRVVR